MRASREQQGEIALTGVNRLQYPATLAAMALLPLMVWLAWRGRIPDELGELAAAVVLTLLGNAFICGVLSNPHDRYGARVAWLAMLAVLLALARLLEARAPRLAAGQR
jgi:hypothetical protein